jgi:Aldehyde dehydrogenase family
MSNQLIARHWINGEWVDAKQRAESINPATGEVIGIYTEAGEAEATRAIAAARKAFLETDWRANRRLRAKVLNDMADRFEARADGLIEILSLENGKVKDEARFEVMMVPSKLRFNAALAVTDFGRAMETSPGHYTTTLREPAGGRRHHCTLELARRAFHPFARAGLGGRLHCRRQAAGLYRPNQHSDVRSLQRSQKSAEGCAQRLQ